MEPDIQNAPAPTEAPIFQPNKVGLHIESFSANTGLYTPKQFDAWAVGMQEASFKQATSNQIAYGVCMSDPNCAQTSPGNSPIKYKLDALQLLEKQVFALSGWETYKKGVGDQCVAMPYGGRI